MMKAAEAIVRALIGHGTADAFGIPGGVILPLVYAMDGHPAFSPHLLGHEQSAGFAACGYAQASGRLGVAYATRGPGFTNLLTPMADAYCDSLPVLFLTAHSKPLPGVGMRVMDDQELDTCAMVRGIVKFAARIDSAEELAAVFEKACGIALSGRKGPVFLDIATSVFGVEMPSFGVGDRIGSSDGDGIAEAAGEIILEIGAAERPVVLLGDGIDRKEVANLRKFAKMTAIPFLSSRCSHDLLCGAPEYFGYVGSHGIRAANFILSKADLVVAIGNRLNFPQASESYRALVERVRFVRCEIDAAEFARRMPNCRDLRVDANLLVAELARRPETPQGDPAWIAVCGRIRSELAETDVGDTVRALGAMLASLPEDAVVVSDVGNCEFWLSRAAVHSGCGRRTLYSKSMGALGCGIGKAIGACYATGKPVLCVAGDQGLQMNLQELQHIAATDLPVTVAVIDNRVSGMIRDSEERGCGRLLHVTGRDGYHPVDWRRIFGAFGVGSYSIVEVPEELRLAPFLPRGNPIQKLSPEIDTELYSKLEEL